MSATLASILDCKKIDATFRAAFGKILVHAPPKRGKTSLISTLLAEGFEVFVCDFDGADSMTSLVPFLESGDYQLHAQRMTTWSQLDRAIGTILDVKRRHKTTDFSNQVLVIDTITKALGRLKIDVLGHQEGDDYRLNRDHWGQIAGQTTQFVADLLNLPCHVVLLAWSKKDADTGRWIPDLSPSLLNEIAGAVGQLLYLDLEGGNRRQLRSDDTSTHMAGDRSGRLEDRCGTSLGAILRNVAARVPAPPMPDDLEPEDAPIVPAQNGDLLYREVN